MAKQIRLTYEGKDYTLEFTRRTVKQMERNGFVLDEMGNKPNILLPMLFAGAFQANHRNVKAEIPEAIFEKIADKEKLISTLVDMYVEPMNTLMEEPEDDKGKVEWTATE